MGRVWGGDNRRVCRGWGFEGLGGIVGTGVGRIGLRFILGGGKVIGIWLKLNDVLLFWMGEKSFRGIILKLLRLDLLDFLELIVRGSVVRGAVNGVVGLGWLIVIGEEEEEDKEEVDVTVLDNLVVCSFRRWEEGSW